MLGWSPRLKFGAIVVAVFLVFGFVVPLFSPSDPTTWNLLPSNLPASPQHLFGTTDLGQDTFWFLVLAVHNSLIIGLIVATLATTIGVLVGLTAGFKGGIIDRVLTLLTDTFIVIPSLADPDPDRLAAERQGLAGADRDDPGGVQLAMAGAADARPGPEPAGAGVRAYRVVLGRVDARGSSSWRYFPTSARGRWPTSSTRSWWRSGRRRGWR